MLQEKHEKHRIGSNLLGLCFTQTLNKDKILPIMKDDHHHRRVRERERKKGMHNEHHQSTIKRV